jgi:type I restriction enzyme S subunit
MADAAVPEGWELLPLTDAADVVMGQSPPGTSYNTEGQGLPFFQGKAEFGDDYPTARKWCTTPKRVAEPGDILISVRAPVGPTNIADQQCAIGRGLAAIRARPGVPGGLVRHAIKLQESEIASWGTGTTFTAINKAHFKDIRIPLPPVDLREPLTATLDTTVRLRRSSVSHLTAARRSIDRFRQAVLTAACSGRLTADWRGSNLPTEPANVVVKTIDEERRGRLGRRYKPPTIPEVVKDLPDSWCWTTVGALLDVATGATPLRKRSDYYNGSIPWVTSGAVNAGVITKASEFITELAIKETNAKVFPAGTLLVAMYGEGQTRGRVAELALKAATNQALAALLFNEQSKSLRSYMRLFFLENYERIRSLSFGGVQPNLSLGAIRDTPVPLPPVDEQIEIVRRVDQMLTSGAELQRRIDTAEHKIKRSSQSILAKAFRGELVTSGVPE